MIEQDKLFNKFGFTKCQFELANHGCIVCYKAPDGCYYKIDHFHHYYVIEFAECEYYAKRGVFEDTDLFDDSLSEEQLYSEMIEWIKKYVY